MHANHIHITVYLIVLGELKLQSNKKVWELIKESVPLGKSFGDACISEKHCNFFVNTGKAKASDIEKLIHKQNRLKNFQ